jgi:hypothetical protein
MDNDNNIPDNENRIRRRAPRAVRVVPREPALRSRYRSLLYTLFILAICILNLILTSHTVLLNYSLFNLAALFYLAGALAFNSSFKRWRALDRRRQQAARYNLTTRLGARTSTPPRADVPALPDVFVITARRDWLFTGIFAPALLLLLCLLGAVTYSYAQSMLQEVAHGIAPALVLWEIALNIAPVLASGSVIFTRLVMTPRQGLIATRDGLLARSGYRTRFIPWHEARLFAIIGQVDLGKQKPVLFYELASSTGIIRWPSAPTFVAPTNWNRIPSAVTLLRTIQGITSASIGGLAQQVEILNIIVAERSGLPLYDLR